MTELNKERFLTNKTLVKQLLRESAIDVNQMYSDNVEFAGDGLIQISINGGNHFWKRLTDIASFFGIKEDEIWVYPDSKDPASIILQFNVEDDRFIAR